MAAWTKDEVIAVAPELGTTPPIADSVFTFWIGIANRQIDPVAFGDRVMEAGASLTAHRMIRAGYGANAAGAGGAASAAGAVSGISVGKVSVQFATLAQSAGGANTPEEAELMTTRPGALYLSLVRMCVASPIVLDSDLPSELE